MLRRPFDSDSWRELETSYYKTGGSTGTFRQRSAATDADGDKE